MPAPTSDSPRRSNGTRATACSNIPTSSGPRITCAALSISTTDGATASRPNWKRAGGGAARGTGWTRALPQARCFKIGDLDLLVQMSFSLGYEPRVVLNYRDFEHALASTLVGRKHIGPDELAADYVRICRQGVVLLQTFGGCVVGYEEMLGEPGGPWLNALAQSAGLEVGALRQAAAKRIRGNAPALADTRSLYPECRRLHELLRELSGRCFAPSRTVVRAIEGRRGKR